MPAPGPRPIPTWRPGVGAFTHRSLWDWTDAEGVWHLHCRNNPQVGAAVRAALDPLCDRLFREARAEGRREPLEAYAADALAELAAGAAGGGADEGGEGPRGRQAVGKIISLAKILVRVDLEALLRGYPTKGETCEIVGFGPVAVSAIRDMIDTGDPFLAAIVTRGEKVVGVAHHGRRANAAQQSALEFLYPRCANEACGALAHLENDHREDWAATHVTLFDLLDRLCRREHYLKTHEGWSLVAGYGRRAFVSPDDPRHPRHAGAGGGGPPAAA